MGFKGTAVRRLRAGQAKFVLAAVLVIGLSGCSDSLPSLPNVSQLNPFKEKQKPLPGKRIPVLKSKQMIGGELATATKPITLPAPQANQDWAQPGGDARNAPGHLALAGAVRQAWSASAGTGSSKSGRITASPIVYGGRVFTLDASGRVSAFSLSGGGRIWQTSLVPESEAKAGGWFEFGSSAGGGYGGGLAAEGGRLFGVSGFGRVAAMDPGSGRKAWEVDLGTPVRAAPTVADGKVFIITMEGRFYCLSAGDGAELWVARGLPQKASLLINSSPAVDGDVVVVPYPSGDVIALKVSDGSLLWSDNLSGPRTTSQMSALSDAARPAIAGGVVFAVGHSGRMVATKSATGERLWSLDVPGVQMPWVAGDNVFVVDTKGQLLAVSRDDGKIRWTAKLPGAETWSGPTLAGNSLWLVSSKGQLASVDPISGRVKSQQTLSGSVYIPPVVAQNRMFVLTDSATLIALN